MPNADGTITKDEATLMVCRNAWTYRQAHIDMATGTARGLDWHKCKRAVDAAAAALDGSLNCLAGIVKREKEAEAARIAAHAPAEQQAVA